jgi:hypothetical protein
MPPPNRDRQAQFGRVGALESWSRTPDRTARTAPARHSGPSSIEWHLARLDAELFADATDEQKLAAAESARRAYFARLALKSAKARRCGGPDDGRAA